MSELKACTPKELVMQDKHNEPIYLKFEADNVIAELKDKARHYPMMVALLESDRKVIAELKQKINEAHTELELWRDGYIISEAHQKELDEKRHSDYKRCLAMATWCAKNVDHLNSEGYIYEKEGHAKELADCITGAEFYDKWYRRWLELAEKLKEAK